MLENYSDQTITGWMAWIHLAMLLVPVMIFTVKLEWDEYHLAHPEKRTSPLLTPHHA